MRTLKTIRVGDVVSASALSREDYFLCTAADASIELVNIGPDRFRDVELTDRTKRTSVDSIEDLGRVQRFDHMKLRTLYVRS